MHDMRTVKWKMKNDMILIDMIWMKNDSWVIFNNVEKGKILGPHELCVLMHWGIPLFYNEGTDTYTTRQENYHYVLHNVVMTVTNSNGFGIKSY